MSTSKERDQGTGHASESGAVSPAIDAEHELGTGSRAESDQASADDLAETTEEDTALLIEDRLARARELVAAGDGEGAFALYREVLLKDSESIAARLGLAELHDQQGQQLQAMEQLEAAREIAPEDVVVLTELGAVLGALGKFQEAERELRRAERLAPDRAEAYQVLGTLYFKRGLYGQAEQELARAIELDATHAPSYYYRGEALHQIGKIDKALDMLMRAVDLDPKNGRAYHTMGIIYDRKHLRTEAAEMYRRGREASTA